MLNYKVIIAMFEKNKIKQFICNFFPKLYC